MPHIRPISDLRNHAHEISDLCHEEREPVFITRNGKGDMVVMSQAHYNVFIASSNCMKSLVKRRCWMLQGNRALHTAR